MRWLVATAAFFGASSVILGAALRHLGGEVDMDILQTALRYHQLHSIVLLVLGLYALNKGPSIRLIIPAILFILGILIFSGSLYALAIWNVPFLGYLTPFGGMALILGWVSVTFIADNKNQITST